MRTVLRPRYSRPVTGVIQKMKILLSETLNTCYHLLHGRFEQTHTRAKAAHIERALTPITRLDRSLCRERIPINFPPLAHKPLTSLDSGLEIS